LTDWAEKNIFGLISDEVIKKRKKMKTEISRHLLWVYHTKFGWNRSVSTKDAVTSVGMYNEVIGAFNFYYRKAHYATSRKVVGSTPDEVTGFFNWPNPSNRTMALGSTQPLTKINTRNFPGGKGRPARKADNLFAIYEPIFWKMWEPWRLKILWGSMACYRDNFTSLPFIGRHLK
jgi:hypothetical protein